MTDTAAIIRGPAILTWLVVSLTALAYIFLKGYQRRASFNRLRRQGLPMPPWNPFLGHLLALSPVLAKLPSDTQQPGAFEILCKTHEKKDGESLIYLDLWPFAADPLLVICLPTLAVQACQDHDLPRPEILHKFFDPLAGGDNLFTMNGPEWKRSRALFNPGFSSSYILQQIGHVVDEAAVYASKLREHARQAVTLNSGLQSQTRFNPLASAMRRQIRWHVLDNEFNLLVRWNPARPIWIDDQDNTVAISSSRSIIDIVLADKAPRPHGQKNSTQYSKSGHSPKFAVFIFGGHDSTASTICYIFYLLQSHPQALAKLRQEHDIIFGNTVSASEQLKQNPALINRLPYTTAVIKETLRLFPPGSAFRRGQKDVYLTDPNGTKYPTEGTNMWILHSALQKHEKYWPHASEFKPERWLITDPEAPLYTGRVKGGWRPFEHGPRDCIGQTLAKLDLKVTLVMTVREFDVQSAYDEWDLLHAKEIKSKIKHVNGEQAYQIQSGGIHPADGFPCRVSMRTE
ncbi:Cytochrome P450 [Rhypophila decipiens]